MRSRIYLYRDGLSKDFVAHGCTTTHFAAHAVRDMIHKGHMPTRLPSCTPAFFLLLFRWCFIYLKGARDLCRSLDLMKKQCVVGSTQLQNRCLLRQRIFHLPAAYPRIDPASLIQTDPQRFWITGRLSSVYHRCHLFTPGVWTPRALPRRVIASTHI